MAAVVAGGCRGSKHVPQPPLARIVPAGYRTLKVYRARLTGGPVPDVVVASTGPPTGDMNFHSADVQVVSWDPLARRWTAIFDAQKVEPPDEAFAGPQTSNAGAGFYAGLTETTRHPLLDPKAGAHVDRVRFVPLLGKRHGDLLVFSATYAAPGGAPSTLAVVDATHGVADLVYTWDGDGLTWRVHGSEISAHASYWTRLDAHCCPSRRYAFALAGRDGSIAEIADDRPFLGVLVREVGPESAPPLLRVTEVGRGVPAAGRLEVGDVIVGVEHAPRVGPWAQKPPANSVLDRIARFHAGQTARLVVVRDGRRTVVPVKLGSLKDPKATTLIIGAGEYDVDAL